MPSTEVVHLKNIQPPIFTVWERQRHRSVHWLVECFAEFMGVFFYVYAGVGSQLTYILGGLLQLEGLSSVLQIGLAYCCGIILAIVICAGTSGGHFNPCVTISFMVFKRFPVLKGLRYIAAQILGAYVACLLIYAQSAHLIQESEALLASVGKLDAILFTPQGPAGAFALSVAPGSKLGQVFLNEFITDIMLGLVIFGCLDPTNSFVSPTTIPVVIALAYAVAIWGFSTVGLAANAARDVGGRLAAITIWGTQASGGSYAAIAALTNIAATLVAYVLHELFLTDYSRVVPRAQREFYADHMNHEHNPDKTQVRHLDHDRSSSSNGKGEIRETEVASV